MERVRLAVIGAGQAGEEHLKSICASEEAVVGPIIDADEDRAQRVAELYRGEVAGSDLRLALSDNVDAVVVATPTNLHYETAATVVAAGKPVLVEKPVASSLAEAKELADAAEAAGVICMAGQVLRFMPIFLRAADLIADGVLGRPIHAIERRLCLRREPLAWWQAEADFLLRHWGSHSIDLLIWLLGVSVERVSCEASSEMSGYEGEDDVALLLGFSGAAKATISYSFASRYEVHDLVVVGEDATLSWSCYSTLSLDDRQLEASSTAHQMRRAFDEQLAHFVACVRGRDILRSAVADTLPALAALDAGVRSMHTHRSISLADA